jgi:hypothetical protein
MFNDDRRYIDARIGNINDTDSRHDDLRTVSTAGGACECEAQHAPLVTDQ